MKNSLKNKAKQFWKDFRFNLSATENPLFMNFYKHLYQPKKGSIAEFLSEYSLSKQGDFHV
ncbi:MAG TPA: FkbM family methyltransferase, partial [Algoriphagus sp.]|nr:FkbM family methyltransferase [Algoriphagus sp.]